MFFLCLERFKPMKYSKNVVGSFKNTVYRKSDKIEPRSDFWQIWGVFVVPFLKILRYFVKKIVSWKSSKKKWPPSWNTTLLPLRAAPWQPPSRAHFSNKKQLFEQLFEALFEFIVKINDVGYFCFFVFELLWKKWF